MPKLGRRDGTRGANHESQLNYMFPTDQTTSKSMAPFGTDNTPAMRVRLVGGVPQMIVEDHRFKEESKEVPPTPVRLAPKAQSNRMFNPDKINTYPMSIYGYDKSDGNSVSSDSHRSRLDYSKDLNPDPRRGRAQFSPHRVLPPVGGQPRGLGSGYTQPTQYPSDPTSDLEQKLPLTTYLPTRAITFRKMELLELKKRVCEEMRDFDLHRLKDVYMTLTGFDNHLQGYVTFEQLKESLTKYRTDIATNTLRLVASQYINEEIPPRVNYEKVLSFISGSLKEANAVPAVQHDSRRPMGGGGGQYPEMLDKNVNVSSPQEGIYYNPLTHTVDDFSSSSNRFPGGVKDNAKLLRLVEQQLLDFADEQELDLQLAWRTFSQADQMRRNMLSRDQIKALSNACKIPLQDTLMNQIIDRCDSSNGQYNWQQYLEFIEKVAPVKTGLRIPESKKPSEYIKHVPQPSRNWPNQAEPQAEERYSGPVPNSLKGPSQYYDEPPRETRRPDNYGGSQSPAKGAGASDPYGNRDSRQSHVAELDAKIKNLEMQYNRDKERLYGDKKQAIVEEEPWFDRFYRLANALYANDRGHAGEMDFSDAYRLISEYNREYRLGISESNITKTLNNCNKGGQVVLDALVKSLMMYEV